MSRTRMATLAFILSELFPLIVSDAILCTLHNLNYPPHLQNKKEINKKNPGFCFCVKIHILDSSKLDL